MLKDYIEKAKDYPLSNYDIKQICGLTVVPYDHLYQFTSIEDIFNTYQNDGIIILYQNSPTTGHYCLLTILEDDTVMFYDSYGLSPDHQLLFQKYNTQPVIKPLLDKYKKYTVNNHLQQNARFESNVCGSYCILRYQTKEYYTHDEFDKFLQEGAKRIRGNKDDFVTLLMSSVYFSALKESL